MPLEENPNQIRAQSIRKHYGEIHEIFRTTH